ncbi:MAG: hypothetical protein KIT84_00480 [Labilithrix sp.]|nr:hypothetical protein [Labilithrix sp.]MCW5809459.1 hypothetical protein [Labilithrix sp.]
MSKGERPAEKKDEKAARAAVERELREEYASVFGVGWPSTPWGPDWPLVIRDAREADVAFFKAEQALADVLNALRRAKQVLVDSGLDRRPYVASDPLSLVGLTAPEAVLHRFFASEEPRFDSLLSELEGLVEKLRDPNQPELVERRRNTAVALRPFVERVGRDRLEVLREFIAATYRTGTTRRIVTIDRDPYTGAVFDRPHQGFVVFGRPPRAPGSDEWRRAYLVALLDGYPLPRSSDPDHARLPTNREIAIVSLLLGGLDPVGPKALARGIGTVIGAERKAIAIARQRNGGGAQFRRVLDETDRVGA